MNIYLDMDDVLCDTAGAYVALLWREFGRRVPFEAIFSFNLQKSFGLSDEQNRHLFARAHEPGFVRDLEPLDGMIRVLEGWDRDGITISIVTGRHTSTWSESQCWLENRGVPYHSFTMVDKYGWPDTDRGIAIGLNELAGMDFDLGVEDSPEMAAYLAGTMALPVLLFDRPWNRGHVLAPGSCRCMCWADVAGATDRIGARGQECSVSRNRDS